MARPLLFTVAAFALLGCSDAIAETAVNEDELPHATINVAAPAPEMDNYTEFAAIVARHQAMSERVARISRRLRVANAPLCDVTRLDAGLSTHRLDDYPPDIRPLALHFMTLGEDGRFIRAIVPGSPADQADIRPGEEIISGWPIQPDRPLVIDDGFGSAPIAITPEPACVAPTFVINAPRPNASTDGREIELSTALVEQVGDDAALALIIAHEMSHVLRGHRQDGPRWVAELQADADALTLMRNAGYDIDATVAGWEVGIEIHRDSQSLSATHPPVEIRLHNLEQALARLNAGPDGFVRLAVQ